MYKRIITLVLVLFSWVSLTGCASATSGLKAYVDSLDGYEFLYPNGWVPVDVSSGADVVFRDLIQATENVSVVVSPLTQGKTLAELGAPKELGERLAKRVIAPPESGRQAELISAEQRQVGEKSYYNLEYVINLPSKLPSQASSQANQPETDTPPNPPQTPSIYQRHTLTSVAVSRGKLYTLSVSAPENRWSKVQKQFDIVTRSFTVY
jgi:photosystem II oxygen-evolving enhancer protein 2